MIRRNPASLRRAILATALLGACFALSGCDKCGDWFWQGSTKSCHAEPAAH